jgi:hypothetical protein
MGLSAPDITTVSNPKIKPANAAVNEMLNKEFLLFDERPGVAMLVFIRMFEKFCD